MNQKQSFIKNLKLGDKIESSDENIEDTDAQFHRHVTIDLILLGTGFVLGLMAGMFLHYV